VVLARDRRCGRTFTHRLARRQHRRGYEIPADGDRADQPVPFSAAPASAAAAPSPLILSCPRMLALRFSDAPAHAFQPASLPPHMTMILGPVSIFLVDTRFLSASPAPLLRLSVIPCHIAVSLRQGELRSSRQKSGFHEVARVCESLEGGEAAFKERAKKIAHQHVERLRRHVMSGCFLPPHFDFHFDAQPQPVDDRHKPIHGEPPKVRLAYAPRSLPQQSRCGRARRAWSSVPGRAP
jgi:hypothetical protein